MLPELWNWKITDKTKEQFQGSPVSFISPPLSPFKKLPIFVSQVVCITCSWSKNFTNTWELLSFFCVSELYALATSAKRLSLNGISMFSYELAII